MKTRRLSGTLAVSTLLVILTSLVWAQAIDDDATFVNQLIAERNADIADVPAPGPADPPLRPVERVPRDQFGVVGPSPLGLADLQSLLFPSADSTERAATLQGLTFFTTEQTAATGRGPVSNQPNCLGCHTNSGEAVAGLVQTISPASRAARSSPTNFAITGQGQAADHDDAINDTGKTAAFTIFGDFNPATRVFNGLTQFFGFVQHTRPSIPTCPPEGLPSFAIDPNLTGLDPINGWQNNWLAPSGFRRQVAERAAPPYLGRGLMEAIPNADILALADPADTRDTPIRHRISGRANFATTTQTIFSRAGTDVGAYATPRLGRFGLRAQGPQLIVFDAVGSQEEVGTTSVIRPNENTGPGIPPSPGTGCEDPFPPGNPTDPDVRLSEVFSLRNMIRLTSIPEFGDTLLGLLQSPDPTSPRAARGPAAKDVQRGARLFGVDLIAFANRMIPGRMPAGGDGRDLHARIVLTDLDGDDDDDVDHDGKKIRTLNCAGCHTPVQRTGRSPANVGARHLSFVWAPIFSDMLLHNMPVINAERFAPTPRLPLLVRRGGRDTFDLPRNFGEDALPNQGTPTPNGDEFRTAPLMGLGRIGPPFLHDARVYLSRNTVKRAPASTVMTSSNSANIPLVVRTVDDAIRAAIELHDLPAPRPGCPVPPVGTDGLVRVGDVVYGSPADAEQAICPPLDSPNRSEAREVIRRFRALSPEDQQALIEFLKEL